MAARRLPGHIEPGEKCRVTLKITTPREPGEYQLECDLVHEGISWFADKGSETWRATVTVGGSVNIEEPFDEAADPILDHPALSLPDMTSLEPPGAPPMHGVHRDVVVSLVERRGGQLLHLEIDDRRGPEWIGYRYFVKKKN